MYENENKQPDTIYVGITDGKNYSIVGEGYPHAKEYVSMEKVMELFEAALSDTEHPFVRFHLSFMKAQTKNL